MVSKSQRDRSIFHCIHYGANTYNDRGLEPRVVKDGEGGVMSERQRDTYCRKEGYLWMCQRQRPNSAEIAGRALKAKERKESGTESLTPCIAGHPTYLMNKDG